MKIIDGRYSNILTEQSLDFLFKDHPQLTKDLHKLLIKASEFEHTAFVKCYNGFLFTDLMFQKYRFAESNKEFHWFPLKIVFEECIFWGIPYAYDKLRDSHWRMPRDKSSIKIDWWRPLDLDKIQPMRKIYIDLIRKYKTLSDDKEQGFINGSSIGDLFDINLEYARKKWGLDQQQPS